VRPRHVPLFEPRWRVYLTNLRQVHTPRMGSRLDMGRKLLPIVQWRPIGVPK